MSNNVYWAAHINNRGQKGYCLITVDDKLRILHADDWVKEYYRKQDCKTIKARIVGDLSLRGKIHLEVNSVEEAEDQKTKYPILAEYIQIKSDK